MICNRCNMMLMAMMLLQVKLWLQRCILYGQYDTLMLELMKAAHEDFNRYMRMPPEMFCELLDKVGPQITKMNTRRFLATGNSYASLEFDDITSLFAPEVCDAIILSLSTVLKSCLLLQHLNNGAKLQRLSTLLWGHRWQAHSHEEAS